jgi:hypothetical protein
MRCIGNKRTLLAIWPSFYYVLAITFNCYVNAYLAAVAVPQVKRVARKLHAIRPLDKRCAVSLCPQSVANPQDTPPRQSCVRTRNLPSKVSGNSGGHFVCADRDVENRLVVSSF